MKNKLVIGFVIFSISFICINMTTKAWDAEEARRKWWERYNQTEEAVKEIIEDENCYNNYSGTIKTSKSAKTTKKSSGTSSTTASTYSYSDIPRGYVYGVDELHVTGLPVDERGYTRAGDYGKIEAK